MVCDIVLGAGLSIFPIFFEQKATVDRPWPFAYLHNQVLPVSWLAPAFPISVFFDPRLWIIVRELHLPLHVQYPSRTRQWTMDHRLRPVGLLLFHQLYLAMNAYIIAYNQATGFSYGAPVQSKILPVNFTAYRKTGFSISPGIFYHAAKFHTYSY